MLIALACGGVLAVFLAPSLPPRYLELVARIPQTLADDFWKLFHPLEALVYIFISAPDPEAPPVSSFWELVVFLAAGVATIAPFIRSRSLEARLILPALAILLEGSFAIVWSNRPFSSRQGILLVAPYMVVGAYALPYAWQRRQHQLLALASVTLLYVVTGFLSLLSFRFETKGALMVGLDGGARYVLTLYPLGAALSLIAVHVYRQSDRHWFVKSAFSALVAALVLVAGLYEIRGVLMLRESKRQIARWEDALPPQGPIVTDLWWLAAWAAPFFTQHEMYCVQDAAAVSDWLLAARAHGVETFTYASFTPPGPEQLGEANGLIPEAYHFTEGLHLTRFHLSAPAAAPPGAMEGGGDFE